MIKIIGSRCSGKSTQIVRLCKNLGGILLAVDYTHKKHYIEYFKMNPKKVLTVREYLKLQRKPKEDIYVDDADYVFSVLLQGKLVGLTININEPIPIDL